MQKLFVVELVFIMLVLFVRKGQSFRCYKCRSDVEPRCFSRVEDAFIVDCPKREGRGEAVCCRKTIQKLKFKNDQNWTVIRECGYERGSAECYHFKWMNLGYQTVCECTTEHCNGASSHVPHIAVVIVLFILLGSFNYLKCDNT